MISWRVLVSLGAAMLPVLLQAVPAEAAPVIVEGSISITTGSNNRCLDADLGTIGGNGTRVQLWDCNGWNNQKWIRTGAVFVNTYNNRCLDADLGTIGGNGTRVQLWNCNGRS